MDKHEAHDRLHFIVKSFLLGQLVGITTLVIVFFIGKVDVIQLIIIGGFAYLISLVILRFLSSPIEYLTNKILAYLDKHPHAKNFILSHF